jgi:hypothetical protein
MSNTLQTRVGDLRAYADAYKIPIKLSLGELIQCTEFAKLDVFMSIFPEYNHLFRVNGDTFDNAAAWSTCSQPFFGLAGRQYVAGTPNVIIRFGRPSMIPMLTRNPRIAGTALQPVLYLSDQSFNFLPNSIVGASIEYFAYPAAMVNLTDTDSMPKFSEPDIARSGFERMLKILLSNQAAVQLTQQEIERTERALKEVFEKKYGVINRELIERD